MAVSDIGNDAKSALDKLVTFMRFLRGLAWKMSDTIVPVMVVETEHVMWTDYVWEGSGDISAGTVTVLAANALDARYEYRLKRVHVVNNSGTPTLVGGMVTLARTVQIDGVVYTQSLRAADLYTRAASFYPALRWKPSETVVLSQGGATDNSVTVSLLFERRIAQ